MLRLSKKCFDHSVKNDERPYDNIQKIETSQEDDCIIGCLLDYVYYNDKMIKMIAI